MCDIIHSTNKNLLNSFMEHLIVATILLVVIYIAFIGLGVPDSLIGSSWPAIHTKLNMPVEAVSILTLLISGCTVLSSMFSARFLNKLGTAKVTSYLIGSAYSGGCIYETTFTLPDEKIGTELEIDLGDVHFVVAVYLNDQFLETL